MDDRLRREKKVSSRSGGPEGADRLLNTAGLLLLAIRTGVLSVAEADKTLEVLAKYRFKVNFKTFRDLLEEPWH